MPISHTIPIVSSDAKIFARTSHECKMVSPKTLKMGRAVKTVAYLPRNGPDSHIHWSQTDELKVCIQHEATDGISSSGPTLKVAPRLLAMAILSKILSKFPFGKKL
jgi:hypothetical protein